MSARVRPVNILVLISGHGTNLQALIDASTAAPPSLPNAKIVRVISNRKQAYGLQRAENASIPTTYHNLVSYKKRHPDTEAGISAAREQYDIELAKIITSNEPAIDLVVCAGWMHILSDPFIRALEKANVKIINLHPALPGKFNGANAIRRAWEAYQRGEIAETGLMIHHVIGEVDMGEPIVVQEIDCRSGEPEEELEERMHKEEWKLIVDGTRKVVEQIQEEKTKKAAT